MSVAIIVWGKVGSGVVLTRRGSRGSQKSTRLGLEDRLSSCDCHRIRNRGVGNGKFRSVRMPCQPAENSTNDFYHNPTLSG